MKRSRKHYSKCQRSIVFVFAKPFVKEQYEMLPNIKGTPKGCYMFVLWSARYGGWR